MRNPGFVPGVTPACGPIARIHAGLTAHRRPLDTATVAWLSGARRRTRRCRRPGIRGWAATRPPISRGTIRVQSRLGLATALTLTPAGLAAVAGLYLSPKRHQFRAATGTRRPLARRDDGGWGDRNPGRGRGQ